jgi:hypothetical protein
MGALFQDRLADWTVGRNITLILSSTGRRRKAKSQVWESKIWLRFPRDSDPRKTRLARTSSIYKRQTRPLVREGAPQNKTVTYGARQKDLLIDWPSVAMWHWLWLIPHRTHRESSPLLCTICTRICINDDPQTPGVYLTLFADDTCLYATDRNEGFVVRKLQRGLSSIEIWCERRNIKIN